MFKMSVEDFSNMVALMAEKFADRFNMEPHEMTVDNLIAYLELSGVTEIQIDIE